MDKTTKARLKKAGFVETTVSELLGLSPAEEALIEVRLALTEKLRETRETKGLTQVQLAGLLGSSQSRVAKMEAGARDVTIDLLLSSLFRLGLTQKDVARAIKGA
jgi:predicted XRE-type DNA-binding protein